MSLRVVVAGIVGLLVAVLIPTLGYYNSSVVGANSFVGNHLPLIVFGPLVLLLVLGSILRALTGWRIGLRGSEAAVILTMALVACSVPGSNLLGSLSRSLAGTIQTNQGNVAWDQVGAFDMVPSHLLPNDKKYDQDFMTGLQTGMGKPEEPISLGQIPWDKWTKPLSYWVPLALLLSLATICLAIILHEQWSKRERLNYPVAEVANALLNSGGPSGRGSVFRDRLFWVGLALALGVQFMNGLAQYTDRMISIPRQYSFFAFLEEFPILVSHWQSWRLFNPEIWPIAIAFGYLIASDVGLSLGISQLVFILATSWLLREGVNIEGTSMVGAPIYWQRAGSCLAVALLAVYTGRKYFRNVLGSAFGLGGRGEVESHITWACRFLLVCLAGTVAWLVFKMGLDWPFAVLFVLLTMVAYTIQGRINAESGLLLTHLGWMPSAVLLGLFGAKAMGPKAFVIVGLLCAVFFMRDLQECLMPFVLNALRISDRQGLHPKRAGWLSAWALLAAVAVAVPFGLWVDHNYGVSEQGKLASGADAAFNHVEQMSESLGGDFEVSKGLNTWQRLAAIRPDLKFLGYAGLGVVLVLVISSLRLRFARWPIHPIMFLVWGTWPMARLSASLFLGWVIRHIVSRIGGTPVYRRGRAFMYGVIGGEFLGGVLWLAFGMSYHAVTGEAPKNYGIYPGG